MRESWAVFNVHRSKGSINACGRVCSLIEELGKGVQRPYSSYLRVRTDENVTASRYAN